ncbi:MAG: indole-3-glycerol phosphate synthase TrpC [Thermomicrobiales bacterium]
MIRHEGGAASAFTRTGSVLDEILARTEIDVAERKSRVPLAEVERRAAAQPAAISLRSAMRGPGVALLAEIKRASPSRGRFPVEIDPAVVAREYLEGGAAALSVLTEGPHFEGSMEDLMAAAEVAHSRRFGAPVLRKDFMIDEYQVVEARAIGADAILLIVAALSDAALARLAGCAQALGMDALVEVHSEEEMARAAAVGAALIGINNRDLRTFHLDLAVTERLAPLAPNGATLVGESGIYTPEDVKRLRDAGVDGILVGESLITSPNRSRAVRDLLAMGLVETA